MGVETSSIAANVEVILERILRAAQRSGRKPAEITLVAVAKMFPAESIRAAYAAGLRHFGENRVQEWEAKRPLLADVDATWHLVGHLQGNKAARAVRLFHCVDSLDSIALAQKLDHAMASLCSGGLNLSRTPSREPATDGALKRTATRTGGTSAPVIGEGAAHRLPVLIEVHLGDEPSKTGVTEADLPALAEAALALPHLDLRGLMCLPPYFDDPERVRPFFRHLRELRDALRRHSSCHSESASADEESLLPELSMGMSHDFEAAIEEGATEVRLGTAIFGSRARP